jgi:hypothetical protein
LGLSSGFRVIVAHSPVAPHRIEFTFRLLESLFITDWQFASSCFPRTDFAAAVTFSYRPVDPDLTGTRTPPHQRFRSRTTKPLRGGGNGWFGGFASFGTLVIFFACPFAETR